MSNTYAAAGLHGGHVMRIRLPSARDVLSGRGGDINSHDGNVQFREWVRERKGAYTSAGSKTEKVRVATEVIDLVKGRGGRFLQKDPKSVAAGGMGCCWWIEMDHDKAVSKTSQALREGAPQIRRAAVTVRNDNSSNNNNKGERRQPKQAVVDRLARPMTPTSMETSQATKPAVVTSPEASPRASPKPTAVVSSILPIAMLAEGEDDDDLKRPLPDVDDAYCTTDRPEKRIRTEEPTPCTVASSMTATVLPVVPSLGAEGRAHHHRRSNSLVNVERMLELCEMEDNIEFVNPFADNDEIGTTVMPSESLLFLEDDGEDADTMISKYVGCGNGHDFYPGEEWFDGDDDTSQSSSIVAGCAENGIATALVVDEVVSPEGRPALSRPQVLMAC